MTLNNQKNLFDFLIFYLKRGNKKISQKKIFIKKKKKRKKNGLYFHKLQINTNQIHLISFLIFSLHFISTISSTKKKKIILTNKKKKTKYSGKAVESIEKFIYEKVYPFYGNTHTTSSVCGLRTTELMKQAREIIKKSINATVCFFFFFFFFFLFF